MVSYIPKKKQGKKKSFLLDFEKNLIQLYFDRIESPFIIIISKKNFFKEDIFIYYQHSLQEQ